MELHFVLNATEKSTIEILAIGEIKNVIIVVVK